MSGSQQLLLGGVPTAVPVDPYYNYTTLLLPGNGTNGAQNNTFLDGSTNNFTITRNGNTTQGTFSPFSQTGWSNYFDGNGDNLTVPDNAAFTIGSGDFTIEMWVYMTSSNTQYLIWNGNNMGSNATAAFYISIENFQLKGRIQSSSTAYTATSSALAVPNHSWSHIALVRNGNTLTNYINGVANGTADVTGVTANDSTESVKIGDYTTAGGGLPFIGYISNLRFVKGTAVYTSNFTPSTAPLTAITNTSLLTCQSNRFIDNSTNNFAITRNGDVSVQAFSPFNPTASWSAATYGGSGYFDGSGDYLTTASSANLAIGTSDFCIEYWVYSLNTNEITPFGQWATGNADWILQYRTGPDQFRFYYNSSNELSGNYTMVPNQWTHVAVCRSGTTMSLYVNGTRLATKTDSTSINNGRGLTIGVNPDGPIQQTTGYITDARLVVGSSVYTPSSSTLTVPTAPLTAITNTKFLTNFTNAGIYDATSKNDLETVGNAQISTTQSKFGGSSMYFDGTGDYLFRNGASDFFVINSDYTVECWVYFNSTSGTQILVTYGTLPWYLCIGDVTAGKAQFTWSSSAPTNYHATGTTTLSTGTWYHIAGVRYGSNIYLYVNGTQEAVTAISGSPRSPSTNALAIGANAAGSNTANAYIQDLRITKGIARYTSNFTPPTTAFPLL